MINIENAVEALKELQKYNRVHNDLESYLYEVVEWGLGNREKPLLYDFVEDKRLDRNAE